MKRSTKSKAKSVDASDKSLTEARAKPICLAINSNKLGDLGTALTGCDINAPVYHHTPLFRAVMVARPDMVQFLLEHGADWEIRDAVTRWTPLMMATINAHRSSRRHFTGRAINACPGELSRRAHRHTRRSPMVRGIPPVLNTKQNTNIYVARRTPAR